MAGEDTARAMQVDTKGAGNPIVLVPGGLTGWLSWRPHAEQLASKNKVILVQLLAVEMGLNDEPLPADYSVDMEVAALTRALDGAGIDRADFAAWSYGALVTLSFALHNPDRISSLTLIEPPAMWVLRSRGPLSEERLNEQKQIQALGPGDVTEDQLVWFTHFAGFVPLRTSTPASFPCGLHGSNTGSRCGLATWSIDTTTTSSWSANSTSPCCSSREKACRRG